MADGLLKWANRNTRGHDHVTPANDYEESWADGLCFCALFYAYFPEKIPIKTLKADTDENKIKNLTLAFKVAEEAGIDPLLDPDDTLRHYEKKSIMLYLSEIYGVLKELPLKFQASAEWNKKFDTEEKAKKFAEWKAKKEAEAKGEIYTPQKTARTGSVSGKWQPNNDKEEEPPAAAAAAATTPITAREKSAGSAKARWNPKGNVDDKEPEKKELEKVTPVPTPSKPAAVAPSSTASTSDEGLTYEISGRGKEGGNEGRMVIFTVALKLDGKLVLNPQKDDFVVYVDCPGTPPKFNIMISGGSYHVGFTPGAGGQWWFDFVYRGTWCNEPWMMPIKNKFNKIPDHPYTGTERTAAGVAVKTTTATTSVASTSDARLSRSTTKEPHPDNSICSGRTCEMTDDDCGSFLVTTKDSSNEILKGDYKFDVKISGGGNVPSKFTNNGDGTYSCSFGPAQKGDYTVEVSYKGKLIHNGSWAVRVVDALADVLFEELTILFHATDKYGTLKTSGGEVGLFKVIATGNEEIEIADLEDGRYTLDYHVQPGLNSINVHYGGASISGFPIEFET